MPLNELVIMGILIGGLFAWWFVAGEIIKDLKSKDIQKNKGDEALRILNKVRVGELLDIVKVQSMARDLIEKGGGHNDYK